MDRPRCALCADYVPDDAMRVGPFYVCAIDAPRVPRSALLGRVRALLGR